jgi:hypothetical protein
VGERTGKKSLAIFGKTNADQRELELEMDDMICQNAINRE